MKKIAFILFLCSFVIGQTVVPVTIDLDKSYLTYDGNHPAHKWSGTSNQIMGSFLYNKSNPELSTVDLYVPVITIDSKNSNRDSNMLDVVEDYFYPVVRFTSSKIEKKNNRYQINGEINFHGVKKEISIPVDLHIDGDILTVESIFDIKLTDYNIKRPSLLTMKIKDMIQIRFYLLGYLRSM
ncbi:MAG: YceI family protein [Candidatus Neomarinimicrobiota bacterium]|nr:YceI family protein [Candidatus Neomarinimicrobiota bacterium]